MIYESLSVSLNIDSISFFMTARMLIKHIENKTRDIEVSTVHAKLYRAARFLPRAHIGYKSENKEDKEINSISFIGEEHDLDMFVCKIERLMASTGREE